MRKFMINVNGKSYEVDVEEITGGASAPVMAAPAAAPAPAQAPAAPAVVYVPNEVIRVEHDTLVMTRNVE